MEIQNFGLVLADKNLLMYTYILLASACAGARSQVIGHEIITAPEVASSACVKIKIPVAADPTILPFTD